MGEQEPKELFLAGVDFPEAQQLADLTSVLRDLQAVIELCNRVASLLESGCQDHVLLDALWSMAKIALLVDRVEVLAEEVRDQGPEISRR